MGRGDEDDRERRMSHAFAAAACSGSLARTKCVAIAVGERTATESCNQLHCNIASDYSKRNVKRNPESPGVCCWFFRVVGDWGVWAARRPARRRRGASFRSYASLDRTTTCVLMRSSKS